MLKLLTLALLSSFLCVACSGADEEEPSEEKMTVTDASFGSFKKIHELDGIYLASQPSEADLREARDDHGLKTVLNVRTAEETPEVDQEAQAKALGLDYVCIPFHGPDTLTDSVFAEYRAILGDKARRPLLLH